MSIDPESTRDHQPGISQGDLPPDERQIAGRYKLLQKLGEGGMGAVWLAEQTEPVRRQVAVKIIKAELDSAHVLARFEAERQALAMMDHPNIAKVLDAGTTEDREQRTEDRRQTESNLSSVLCPLSSRPYFVMELVKGIPITKYCDQEKLTPQQRLELFIPVCNAIQHAHQKGIIHRDLKPSNILVALYDGKPVPKVIDFGIAKATHQKLTERTLFTEVGQFVGTPTYMPPEQAETNNLDIDTRADIYSLGVVLYELLTGTTPFTMEQLRQAGFIEMLRIIKEVEPSKPSTKLSSSESLPSVAALRRLEPKRLTKLVSGDLDWIVMKCLEKERSRRYDTANGLAQDIQCYLSDEPVSAGRPGAVYQMRKFVRRNRGPVLAVTFVLLALLFGGVVSYAKYLDAKEQERIARNAREEEATRVRERDAVIGERDKAIEREVDRVKERDVALGEVNHHLSNSNFVLASAAYNDGDIRMARERLDKVPLFHRGWEWHYLRRQIEGGIFRLNGDSAVTSVAFAPDGSRIVTGSFYDSAQVWDARTGKLLVELKGHTSPVNSVAFSPDGQRIVTGSDDGLAKVWDAKTGVPMLDVKGHTVGVTGVAFSPDGLRIVTASEDKSAKVWDANTGMSLVELKEIEGTIESAAFSPDGLRIVTGGYKKARVWDAKRGTPLLELKEHNNTVMSVAFSLDGKRIVTGSLDDTAKIWDANTGTRLVELKHNDGVYGVAFSPDGLRIATGSDDETARVWDAKTGRQLVVLCGYEGTVRSVAFSPDGARIVTASWDSSSRVWDAKTGTPLLKLTGDPVHVDWASFSRDGLKIVTRGDTTAKVWDAKSGVPLVDLKGHVASGGAAFSPDGLKIVTGDYESAYVWDAQTGARLVELKGHHGIVSSVVFSPDGLKIVSGSSDDLRAIVWDAKTGNKLVELKGHKDEVVSVAFSPDGSWIVTGSDDSTAIVWDANTGTKQLELQGHTNRVTSVNFSADGTRIVTGSLDQTARVWDARSGKILVDLKRRSVAIGSASFSPDGKRIVTGNGDDTTTIWDAWTGTPLLDLKGHTNAMYSVSFSPDGTRILTGSWVWDAQGGLELEGNSPTEEWEYRLFWTRPRPDLHREEFDKAVKANDSFAARFHLDRMLAYQPQERSSLLSARIKFQSDELLVRARTAVHSPALVHFNAATIFVLLTRWDARSMRLLGGQLIRAGKPADAITPLKQAIALRANDRPPIEELLLALAYLEAKQSDEAAKWHSRAVTWLDRYQPPLSAVLGGGYLVTATIQKSQMDPRYNPFDWETWYECEVFRAEVDEKMK